MKKINIIFFLLFLFSSLSVSADNDTIINSNTSWKYLDNGSNMGTSWRSLSFNDNAWQSGNAQLGYGDGDETTTISYGPNPTNKYITTYFRKTFFVSNPSQYTALQLQLLRDDGARVFLNNTNIARSNMPTGAISYTTLASTSQGTSKENKYYLYNVSPALLVNGNNVIAVEVHQSSITSDDLGFALRLIGTFSSCGIPANLTATNISTNSADLSWNAVSGALSYNIQYRLVGAGSWLTTTSSANSKSISSLSSETNYEWQVQAVCASHTGIYSAANNFTTLAPPCETPTSLSSAFITTTTATLNWETISNAVSYNIEYRIVGSGTWTTDISSTNFLNISLLTPSSNYEWHVQTVCSSNQSLFSATNNFTTLTPPCGVTTDLAITAVTSTGATCNWTGVSDAISYTIQFRKIGDTWSNTSSFTASVNLSGLTPASTYECRVQTVCQFSTAVFSTSVSFTTSQNSEIIAVQRGPYLQMLTPNSIHIRWKTDVATNSRVNYGTDMSYGNLVDSSASVFEHEIKISGLNPNTKYYYTIGTSTKELQGNINNFFKTSLPTGSTDPFRMWVTGDFGNGSSAQDAVRNAYTTYAGSNLANFWIWLGDNAYNVGSETEFTNYVFSKYPTILKNTPVFPGLGNHDYAQSGYQSAAALGTNFPYFNLFTCPTNAEAGGVASGTEKYYSYNFGNAHFIELDSYGSLNTTSSAMYQWLQNDLNANTQRWTVVYWHHPPYTMGTYSSDVTNELINMRQNIVPLLETYKVDLVLCGHSHVYERSILLNGHYGIESSLTPAMKIDAGSGDAPYYLKSSPNFTGTVYAVVGVSGQGGNITAQASWPHDAMYSYAKTLYGSMIVDFNTDTLSAKFLTSTGNIFDQFKIVKSGTARDASNFFTVEESPDNISVLPNPFTNQTTIRFYSDETDVLLEAFDLAGKQLFSKNIKDKNNGVFEEVIDKNIFGSSTGIFILKVKTNKKLLTKKIERLN